MRLLLWVLVGWMGVVVWSAIMSRAQLAHIVPDAAVATVVFLALRSDPIPVTVVALALGYLEGLHTSAPASLHASALAVCAVGVYVVSGQLAGRGAAFFAVVSALTTMAFHVVLFLLMGLTDMGRAFSSWASAALVPSGVATALLAASMYPLLCWLHERLSDERPERLGWS